MRHGTEVAGILKKSHIISTVYVTIYRRVEHCRITDCPGQKRRTDGSGFVQCMVDIMLEQKQILMMFVKFPLPYLKLQ